MRDSFRRLDGTIASVNNEMEDGDSLDSIRVKAIFYALFFGTESPSRVEHRQFVENFIIYEEHTRTVTTTDADGNGTTEEEIYMVAIPIKKLLVNVRLFYDRSILLDIGIDLKPRNRYVGYRKEVRNSERDRRTGRKTDGPAREGDPGGIWNEGLQYVCAGTKGICCQDGTDSSFPVRGG